MPPGASGARTYLLAAAAAGVGLGVRRRAAAAPGRGVKVPGIILVHDPRWGPERKQGVFLPPPSLRPRTGCCALAPCGPGLGFSLCSRASLPRRPARTGRRQYAGTVPPERLARHFFPALRAPRDRLSTQSLPLRSRRVPPSLPCARSPAPARSQSSARTAGPIKNWKLKKNGRPESHACQVWGLRFLAEQKKKKRKERLPAWRNFYFLLLEKELRINFLWPTRLRSFGATRTLD